MQILNYTGGPVGLSSETGNPTKLLYPDGKAEVSVEQIKAKTVDGTAIYVDRYGTIENLPKPDPNLEKLYIVTEEVAESGRRSRVDLLVGIDPYEYKGTTFYKRFKNILL